MDKTNLILPASIILGCVILGGIYYASVVAQQASAERQQQATLQAQEAQQQATLQAQQVASSTSNLNSQAQCATQGQQFFQKFRAAANTGAETTWQPPEYHFSTKLQTCLMAWQDGGIVSSGNPVYPGYDIESGGVIDILENKQILGANNTEGDWDEYIQQKDVLMSE